jgi:myosin heavy chain 6/7
LEAAERARKAAEGELHEASDRVNELSSANSSVAAQKRKLENDLQAIHVDLEDQLNELRAADENAKRAMADAARLAEELRREQEHAGQIEKLRRALEAQVKELQARLDEAEASALKGGKKIIQKLEQRVRELETELEAEQRRYQETDKVLRKQDKRLKDIALQYEEDRKTNDQYKDTIEKLQLKINTYKRQVEEAEEIAAINLAKYRKVQHDLEESEQRADQAENAVSKLRAKTRSSASAGGSVTTQVVTVQKSSSRSEQY